MVKEITYNTKNKKFFVSQTSGIPEVRDNQKHFYCEVCKLVYKEKEWAEKCEKWCKNNSTCNINTAKIVFCVNSPF